MSEHQHREWKETWRDEYLRWICGFANAAGGALVIGRNRQGKVTGLPNARKLLVDIPNKVRDILGIMVEVNLREDDGKEYLEIVVEPYPYPVSYKGEYHYRSGSTKQELKGAALDRFLLRKQGRTWDGVPVPRVTARDLSSSAVAAFRKLARQSRRLDASVLRESVAGLLEKLNLFDGDHVKRAAVLNAIIHKDYASASPVQIRVHADRLKIWNAGTLPESWSVANLLGEHSSRPFNPSVANAFFRAGAIEAWGRGIQRILDACREAGVPKPTVRYQPGEM